MSEEIAVAIGIQPRTMEDGKVLFLVRMENRGVQEEAIITVIRHWLKQVDAIYHERWSAGQDS